MAEPPATIPPPAPVPFRIRVAVTGTRALEPSGKLSAAIEEALARIGGELFDERSRAILARCPNTPVAFSVLTSLSDGAERVLAEELLCRSDTRLDVVLPIPKEEYLGELGSDRSRAEFERLASRTRSIRHLERKSHFGAIEDREHLRQLADRALARFIVEHSDVLLVVVDARGSAMPALADRVLSEGRAEGRPIVTVLATPPHSVEVNRGNGLNADAVNWIESFNTAASEGQGEEDLLPDCPTVHKEVAKKIREVLEPFYGRANRIAVDNRHLYRWAGRVVYFLSPLAVASVAGALLFDALHPWGFVVEFILLAVILVTIQYAHRSRARKAWMGTRVLAERLRAGVFCAAAGVEPQSIPIPPYMGMAHEPTHWMNRVFDEIWARLPPLRHCAGSEVQPTAKAIVRCWIAKQREFHRRKIQETEWRGITLEALGWTVFGGALVAAFFHLLLSVSLAAGAEWLPQSAAHGVEEVLGIVALVLPAVGASIGGLRSHREYARLARRSEEMEAALAKLERQYREVESAEDLEALVRRTEEVMLSETQGWLMLMGGVKLSAG